MIKKQDQTQTILLYILTLIILMVALSYAAVPLYRMFCQMTGYGGTTQIVDHLPHVIDAIPKRMVTIKFNADVSAQLEWKFIPLQKELRLIIGESGLAFFEAHNPTDYPITGISTYNVTPQQAGIYFNKIQCFCFDEQLLKPHETIEMPVFFFIDPSFLEDSKMDQVDTITLSYTFFRSDEFNAQNND
jgi:cytochrome c oxidase assembly protein subunit 11